MPGVIYYRTEDDLSKLYVYQKSRVQARKLCEQSAASGL